MQNHQLKASLKNLTVGDTSQVRSLATMGDVEGATELAHAALSSMEQVQPSAEVTTEDKTEVRNNNSHGSMVGAVVRSLPSSHKVLGSNPGSAEC